MNAIRTTKRHVSSVFGGLLVALAVVLGLAACGSQSDNSAGTGKENTFEDDRFRITFSYPADFEPTKLSDVSAEHGGDAEATVPLMLDEHDGILVEKYDVGGPVTHQNLSEVIPDLNDIITQLSGVPAIGKPVTVGGFPGVAYAEVRLPSLPEGRSRMVFLFDGTKEYVINCQSTPEYGTAVAEACDGALASLQARS